ncbi:MAG: hypothetical protein IPK77_00025 [Cellvibrio sp.]|nr:hypothetical protein [Cellvibrio sp.]
MINKEILNILKELQDINVDRYSDFLLYLQSPTESTEEWIARIFDSIYLNTDNHIQKSIMTTDDFNKMIVYNHSRKLQSDPNFTLQDQLESIYQSRWYDWNIIAHYVAHPDARAELIAEIWHYAPEFLELQPRWPEFKPLISDIPPTQRDFISINNHQWNKLPAFYVLHLFLKKDVKSISKILTSKGLDIGFYMRWLQQLEAINSHSITLKLISNNQMPLLEKKNDCYLDLQRTN